MAGRQRGAVPVRRGVAEAAVVRRQHLARVVIGGSALQRGACRAHVERKPRLVASVAAGGHEGVLGLRHVRRPEGAGGISARGMAGTAVDPGEIRDVRRAEHRILGREVVGPGERRDVVAMAEPAIAANTGVQHGVGREGCRGVITGRGDVALGTSKVARVGHVCGGHHAAGPIGGRVTHRAVGRCHGRIAALEVIGGAQLQRRAAADVEALAGVVAGVAGRGHERVLGGAHGGGRTEAAGLIGGAMTGAAIGAHIDRDMRRGERRGLGRRYAGNRHRNVGHRFAGESLAGMAHQAIIDRQPGVQHRNARREHVPGFRRRIVAVTNAAVDRRGDRRHVIGRAGP